MPSNKNFIEIFNKEFKVLNEYNYNKYKNYNNVLINSEEIRPNNKINNHSSKLGKKRYTIGFFVNHIHNYYVSTMFYGMKEFVKKHDINLLCFIGSEIESPFHTKSNQNAVFDLASNYNLDGIIGVSNSIGSYISKQKLIDFYNRYSSIPIISIGIEIEGISSILIDNKKAFRDLLIHLIKVHQYNKIAFIKGPGQNVDAEIRFSVFKSVLDEFKMTLNEKLVVQGNFLKNSGKEAVKILLDEREEDIDLIIGSNDYTALGVIEELQERGINVPDDIAVIGFDNIIEGRYCKPRLTTINQPVFNMGYKAINLLYKKLNNKDDKDIKKIVLPSDIIIRESCGCKNIEKLDISNKVILRKKIFFLNDFNKIKDELTLNIKSIMLNMFFDFKDKIKIYDWTTDILNSLFDSIISLNGENFLKKLQDIINESILCNIDIVSWKYIIAFIFENILINLNNEKYKIYVIDLFLKVSELINNIVIKLQNNLELINIKQSTYLLEITNELLNIFELDQLKRFLMTVLPKFGIKSCYLSIFDKGKDSNIKDYSRIIFAYEDFKIIETNNVRYLTKELLPGGFKTKSGNIYVIINLYCVYDQLGFIIYEIGNTSINLLENFAIQISNVLKRLNLYNNQTIENNFNFNKIKSSSNNISMSKYQKSSLSNEKTKKYFNKLLYTMEEDKLYLNPELDIKVLSEKTNLTSHNISYVINEYVGVTFYDFINTYRIKEVIKRLSNNKKLNCNILDIAFESGFKSKSTFNKMFKKYTSMTPSEYIKKNVL